MRGSGTQRLASSGELRERHFYAPIKRGVSENIFSMLRIYARLLVTQLVLQLFQVFLLFSNYFLLSVYLSNFGEIVRYLCLMELFLIAVTKLLETFGIIKIIVQLPLRHSPRISMLNNWNVSSVYLYFLPHSFALPTFSMNCGAAYLTCD